MSNWDTKRRPFVRPLVRPFVRPFIRRHFLLQKKFLKIIIFSVYGIKNASYEHSVLIRQIA